MGKISVIFFILEGIKNETWDDNFALFGCLYESCIVEEPEISPEDEYRKFELFLVHN